MLSAQDSWLGLVYVWNLAFCVVLFMPNECVTPAPTFPTKTQRHLRFGIAGSQTCGLQRKVIKSNARAEQQFVPAARCSQESIISANLNIISCTSSVLYFVCVFCFLFISTMPFVGYFLVRSLLSAFPAHIRTYSRFDLVWFRLSCDHGWIRSRSVNVR